MFRFITGFIFAAATLVLIPKDSRAATTSAGKIVYSMAELEECAAQDLKSTIEIKKCLRHDYHTANAAKARDAAIQSANSMSATQCGNSMNNCIVQSGGFSGMDPSRFLLAADTCGRQWLKFCVKSADTVMSAAIEKFVSPANATNVYSDAHKIVSEVVAETNKKANK